MAAVAAATPMEDAESTPAMKISGSEADALAAKGFIRALMDTSVRVTISDGRLITGQLWCFDNVKNLILLNCQETRVVQGLEHRRPLGPLVMVPGKHITKIEASRPHVELAHIQARATSMAALVAAESIPPEL